MTSIWQSIEPDAWKTALTPSDSSASRYRPLRTRKGKDLEHHLVLHVRTRLHARLAPERLPRSYSNARRGAAPITVKDASRS